jgi:hypothetical protein
MAPNKFRKVVQETVVEKPTQDPDVPPQVMRGGEQKDCEGEEDRDSHKDHESEEEQPMQCSSPRNNWRSYSK